MLINVSRLLFVPFLALFAWSFGEVVTTFCDHAGRYGSVNLGRGDRLFVWVAIISATVSSLLLIATMDDPTAPLNKKGVVGPALVGLLKWANGISYVLVVGYLGFMALLMLVVIFASPLLGAFVLLAYLISLTPIAYIFST